MDGEAEGRVHVTYFEVLRKLDDFLQRKKTGIQGSSSPEVQEHGTRAKVGLCRVNFLPWFRQTPFSPPCLCPSREKVPFHPS